MSLLILIDGLEMASSSATHERCAYALPVLDRLAATGRTGRLRFADGGRSPEEGGPYFEVFGSLSPGDFSLQHDLPLGYAVALGLANRDGKEKAYPDPERTWCCLGFTHLYRKQNDLLFLSPERTGQTFDECWRLAEAFLPDLQEEGWSLSYHAGRPAGERDFSENSQAMLLLSRAPSPENPAVVRTSPLLCLEGGSFGKLQPSGPYAQSLMRLLTSGQLSLARHPLNLERQRLGRVVLNTPWIWGVGRGVAFTSVAHSASQGHCWTAHPLVAGLARASGYHVASVDEMADFSSLVAAALAAMTTGSLLIHLQLPAVLARHGLIEKRQAFLKRVNDQLLEPLTQAMAGIQKNLLVTSAYSLASDGRADRCSVPWVAACGRMLSQRKRFWHRGRLGQGDSLPYDRLRALWFS